MKQKLFVFSIFSFAMCFSIKAQTWVSVNASLKECPPIIETIESNDEHYKFRVRIPGFYKTLVANSETTYASLNFENYNTLTNTGEPALPIITQMIGLPSSCIGCNVTLMDSTWTNIKIEKIHPYQTPLLETMESTTSIEIIPSAYTSTSYNPNHIKVSNIMNYKGMKNVTLQICPFKYYTLKDSLSIMTDFIVDIRFNKQHNSSKKSPLNITNADKFIINNNIALLQTYATDNTQNEIRNSEANKEFNYLIIGSDTSLLNSQILSKFCAWKALKGYKCKIVNTSTIGKTSSAIKSYIQSQYYQGVEYVLLIGDIDAIPVYRNTWYNKVGLGYLVAGDYWYGCLDDENDCQAEVAVGRFSTNSVEELSNMINKTMAYEQSPSSSNWYNKVLMIAHKENAPLKYQQCLEDIYSTDYQETFSCLKAYGAADSLGGNNASNSNVIDAINSGIGIVNYRGHGTETSWSKGWSVINRTFEKELVDSLENQDYPIVFSIACSNGNIETEECLLESFIRNKQGAVAMLGAFYASFTNPNNDFNKFIFDGLFNQKIYKIGDLSNWAKIQTLTKYGYDFYSKFNSFIYLWGGDPSLEVWTGPIGNISINDINKGCDSIYIETNNHINYTMRIISEDAVLLKEEISIGPNISLVMPSNPCYVVLDRHNYRPYILYCNSTASYIQNCTIEQDSYYCGNNIIIGNNVTSTQLYGDVVVKGSAKMIVNSDTPTIIKNGFSCRKGSTLVIK